MSSTATITKLGLDLKPPSDMVTVIISLREVSPAIGDGEGRAVKLEEYIRNLEEEKRKVEGFKRELPFTIPVMNDVIEGIKKELKQCRSENNASPCPPVLEEFMPVRSNFEEEGGVKPEKDFKEKMSWMSSVQLWNDDYSSDNNNNNNNNSKKKNTKERDEEENEQTDSENLSGERKYKVRGGAFLPFKGISGSSVPKQHPSSGSTSSKGTAGGGGGRVVMPSPENSQSGLHVQEHQGPRKARRCWSPELHRRFVNALQQLGGSQVATPKQIRELMKVDGLTNDEVKSHLQKYRLHTRRPPPASAPANQQLLMLGDLWVNQDHYPVSKQESGSPQGPLQLAGSSRGISVTGGDSCGEEDGKSESYSWKGNLQRSTEEDTD